MELALGSLFCGGLRGHGEEDGDGGGGGYARVVRSRLVHMVILYWCFRALRIRCMYCGCVCVRTIPAGGYEGKVFATR